MKVVDPVEIFKLAVEMRNRHEKANDAIASYFRVVSDVQYPPFLERDELSGFMACLRQFLPDLENDISWHFWERPDIVSEPNYITSAGKEYTIRNDEDFTTFLSREHGEQAPKA